MNNNMVFFAFLVMYSGISAQTTETLPVALNAGIEPNGLYPSDPLQDTGNTQPYYSSVRYDSAGLDSFIRIIMAAWHIPGVATWCSKNGQVIWQQNYGYARLEDSIPVTDSTLFTLMSISKTVTGTAAMQLWERGEFNLDDDINNYLPFSVRNPYFPDSAITFRMLMTHTSSIHENWNITWPLWVHGDSPIPLGSYLYNYLVPGGTYYDLANFRPSDPPGTQYDYCNTAIGLLGYLVQVIEDSFPVHCQDSIFQPLSMDETSWFLANLDTNNIAMGYHWTGVHYDTTALWGMPYYPAASLRTSAQHLAQHLTAIMQHGINNTVRILDSTTVELMTTPQYQVSPNQWMGLVWIYYNTGTRWVWVHDGAADGVSTIYGFCPAENSAAVVLTNGESFWNGTLPIYSELLNYAQQYGIADKMSKSVRTQNIGPTIFSGPLQLPKGKTCRVFDITGRVVEPNNMKPGVYFVEIDSQIVQKVIKVR